MNLRKTILILAAVLVVCSALLFQAVPVSAATDATSEQGRTLQAPPPPPPFPPPPTPPPPIPPTPAPRWYYPPYYHGYPGNVWPYSWPYVWRWSNYPSPNVVIIEQPQRQVIHAPVINSFTANPSYIQPGRAIVLTWTVSNASTVTLSPGIGSVPNSGSYNLTPDYTTTYTLNATNSAGSVSASTTVTVSPYVSTFSTSASAEVTSAGSVTADSGTSSVLTLGFGGDNGAGSPWLSYALLIGLLAVAAAVIIVFVVRKPTTTHAVHQGSTRPGYLPWATDTSATNGNSETTPVDTGISAKFTAANGKSVPISGNIRALGRDNFRSLVTPDKSSLISRKHIQVEFEGGSYYIEDRNSINGTRINGSSISGKGRFLLKDGDMIEVADVLTLTFKS